MRRAIPGTRVADATGNVGHIPTGVYVACFLDHQIRRPTTLSETKRLVLVSFSPARWSRGQQVAGPRDHLQRVRTRDSWIVRPGWRALPATKTSRLVVTRVVGSSVAPAAPLQVERRIENACVADLYTCLARAFHRVPPPPHTQANPRKSDPRKSEPSNGEPSQERTRAKRTRATRTVAKRTRANRTRATRTRATRTRARGVP